MQTVPNHEGSGGILTERLIGQRDQILFLKNPRISFGSLCELARQKYRRLGLFAIRRRTRFRSVVLRDAPDLCNTYIRPENADMRMLCPNSSKY